MKKAWEYMSVHEIEGNEYLFDICRKALIEGTETIGDIRPYFDEWSENELKQALEFIWYLPTAEASDGMDEETEKGDRDSRAYDDLREAIIVDRLYSDVWNMSKTKKRFF